jgi:hypothetical protein
MCAGAIQSMIPESSFISCNGNAVLILVAVGSLLQQLSQQLGHAVTLAYISIGLMGVMTTALVYAVLATDPPKGVLESVDGPTLAAEAFVGMGEVRICIKHIAIISSSHARSFYL